MAKRNHVTAKGPSSRPKVRAAAGTSIVVQAAEGGFIDANELACKSLGRNKEELLALAPTEVFAPDERPRIQRWMGEALQNGECRTETLLLRKDGKLIPVELEAVRCSLNGRSLVVIAWNDQKSGSLGSAPLARKEFERFMDQLPAAAYIKDIKGRTLYFNRFLRDYLGADESWYGRTTDEIFGGDVGAIMRRDDLAAIEKGFHENEETIRCLDGVTRQFKTQKFVIPCGKGRPPLLGGISVDVTDRVAAAMALAASEVKLKAIFESAGEGIVIVDPGTRRVVTGNQRFADIFGLTRDEMIGIQIENLHAPEQVARAVDEFEADLAGKNPEGREICVRRKDGGTLCVHITSTPIDLPEGRFQLGIVRDVTDEKRILDAVSSSETKFRALFEGAGDGIILFDVAGRILSVNNRFAAQIGYSREELLTMTQDQLHSREDRDFVVADFGRHARGEVNFTAEIPVRRKDGSIYYADISSSRVELAEGPAWLAVFRDVTQRREDEAAVRESERRFRLLFENAPIGISLVDSRGYCIVANKAVETMLGYSATQLRSMRFSDFTHPEDQEPGGQMFRELVAGERNFIRIEKRYICGDGRIRWGRLGVTPVHDADGKVLHLIAMIEDITEKKRVAQARKEAQAQMLQTQKLESLGVLAGGIAHDFNNLLMTILGHVECCLEEVPGESRALTSIREIEIASRRGAELCRQMLAYAGRSQPSAEAANINSVVLEMMRLLEVSVPKPAHVEYDLAESVPAVWIDAVKLRQIVMNLVMNAADALANGPGRIKISTGIKACSTAFLTESYVDDHLGAGEYVFLEVSDTGSGMDAATKAKIFDPFFTTKFAGRGLGLASVLGIVRGHGGAIVVASEPGAGSTFTVLFPATNHAAIPEEPVIEVPADLKATAKVLVIDDEPAVLSVTARHLERTGFHVLSAASGREALDLLSGNSDLGLAILDLAMPGMAGDECLRRLRLLKPDLPVIMMSGYDESGVLDRLHGMPTSGFLQKPFKRWELIAVVNRVVGEKPDIGTAP